LGDLLDAQENETNVSNAQVVAVADRSTSFCLHFGI